MAFTNLLTKTVRKAPAAPTVGSRTSPGTVPASRGVSTQPRPAGPMNYQKWVAYHQGAGHALPTGLALKNRYQAYAAAHTLPMHQMPVQRTSNPSQPMISSPTPTQTRPKIMNYQQWVAYHQQNGLKLAAPGPALRDQYFAYAAAHGSPVPGSPQAAAAAPAAPATPPPPVSFDPSVLDAQGEIDMQGLRNSLLTNLGMTANWNPNSKTWDTTQVGNGALQNQLNDQLRQYALQELMAKQDQTEGNYHADSNAASRGMFNSGIRNLNRNKVLANLTNAMSAINAGRGSANTNFQLALADALRQFGTGAQQASTNSYTRRFPAYLAQAFGG